MLPPSREAPRRTTVALAEAARRTAVALAEAGQVGPLAGLKAGGRPGGWPEGQHYKNEHDRETTGGRRGRPRADRRVPVTQPARVPIAAGHAAHRRRLRPPVLPCAALRRAVDRALALRFRVRV